MDKDKVLPPVVLNEEGPGLRSLLNQRVGADKQRDADWERVKPLVEVLEADATDLWKVTNAIKAAIKSWTWITDGRGCYTWDDDRYREETGRAFQEVLALIRDVQEPAANRFHRVLAQLEQEQPKPDCPDCGGRGGQYLPRGLGLSSGSRVVCRACGGTSMEGR